MALTHHFITQHFLYCCLSQEQKAQLEKDLDNGKNQTAYLLQRNLVREKEGFRCSICGKFYPSEQIWYRDEIIEPKSAAKIALKPEKFKKAAVAFFGDHYYALNGKKLLRFGIDADRVAIQTDEIPIMGGVYHTILSMDEKYVATETFRHTVAIIDASTKQTVARKRQCDMNGAFAFTLHNQLLYFFQDAIRCWDFLESREEMIWQVPAEWRDSSHPVHVVCSSVVYNGKDNSHWFQCKAGQADYAVVIKDQTVEKVVRLPNVPTLHDLVYTQEQDLYTLTTEDSILLLDGNGQIRETCVCPQIQSTSDGGGMFCIVQFPPKGPHRAFLSPDGAWMLLDFFTSIMLMRREDGVICHCIYSHTGRSTSQMGFVDNQHFWYVWGDTTYIQEIPEAT
ncbi:MAG: hypothetical protein IKL25_08405 [Clostridia bacterium]|nr:hypothetical protein [Clostridia bacterium]